MGARVYPEEALSKAMPFNRALISNAIKRAFDVVVSLLGLIFLGPIFALVGLAIKRDTPGPVFYRGRRMGRGGKEFRILKFRTMYEKPESFSGPKVTAADDDRITPLGHWLRDTKLNELPQLWNVLMGEMSLVGPRPEDPEIAREWPEDVARDVLAVRPGITSPASVLYRNEETLLNAENLIKKYLQELSPDKMRLDQLYVRYRSFVLDMDIIFWTFLILIPKLHSYQPPEKLLFLGPVTRLMRRYLSWFIIDLVITFTMFSIAGTLWRIYEPLNLGLATAVTMTAAFALLFSMVEAILGVNKIAWSKAAFADIYDLITAWAASTTIAVVFSAMIAHFPLGLVVTASLFALFGFVCVRFRSRILVELINHVLRNQMSDQTLRERVLIIGTNQSGQHAAWMLSHPSNMRKFYVAGFVDDDYLHQGMRIHGVTLLGTLSDIPELVKKHQISLVLLADQEQYGALHDEYSKACAASGARLVVLPDLLGMVGKLAGSIRPASRQPGMVVKRVMPPSFISAPLIPQTGPKSDDVTEEPEPFPGLNHGGDSFELQAQLDDLSKKIETGDVDGARDCIRAIRENMYR